MLFGWDWTPATVAGHGERMSLCDEAPCMRVGAPETAQEKWHFFRCQDSSVCGQRISVVVVNPITQRRVES